MEIVKAQEFIPAEWKNDPIGPYDTPIKGTGCYSEDFTIGATFMQWIATSDGRVSGIVIMHNGVAELRDIWQIQFPKHISTTPIK